MRMLDMSNDSHLFKDELGIGRVPLYEAKMIHQFDHRWATYEGDSSRECTLSEKGDPNFEVTPRYWVCEAEVEKILNEKTWGKRWFVGWRGIARTTDERSVISSFFPMGGVGNSAHLLLFSEAISNEKIACFLANSSVLVFDFVARQKIGGANFNFFIPKQLPFLSPSQYRDEDVNFILMRVIELAYTSIDLRSLAIDLGYNGEPFTFDPERRAILRAELDAYYARLYGLTRDELRYILDPADVMGEDYPSETFRVLKNKEMCLYGEYCTQRLVLEAWDKLEAGDLVDTPVRRKDPLKEYFAHGTPANETEDWWAGVVCDVLLQKGPVDDNNLLLILLTNLSESTSEVSALVQWLEPLSSSRWQQVFNWLRSLLKVPGPQLLSISDPSLLSDVLGDHRTKSLAKALISARTEHEHKLAEIMASQTTSSNLEFKKG